MTEPSGGWHYRESFLGEVNRDGVREHTENITGTNLRPGTTGKSWWMTVCDGIGVMERHDEESFGIFDSSECLPFK